jgi:hypothetical protein
VKPPNEADAEWALEQVPTQVAARRAQRWALAAEREGMAPGDWAAWVLEEAAEARLRRLRAEGGSSPSAPTQSTR